MTTNLPVDPAVEERPAVPYVAVRRNVTPATFAEIADRVPVILGWLAARGVAAAGAPFLRYEIIDMPGTLGVEAGVPLAAPVEGEGEIHPATLPAGRYVTYTHVGHPERLVEITAAVLAWGTSRGLAWDMEHTDQGERWACRLEVFKTHPAEVPDPDDWVTDLVLKLADA
ncbi:GyrI-like domain-containing protein [Actinomadura sp. NEAU-AAG7]|uniref:GyrI-like domain-containing protein n=1 Tax=Actinomadura sp. NEAU-AAG7 TaxID=2839640 RepID=UPI001BE47401|nr:GyrI-like domain-containing protein [Actinomadura sp. NEAU-AAG7]MBT2211210.1 GyrI-like domain-containing protein [Actinomadura sp. NEAU-AAG7]